MNTIGIALLWCIVQVTLLALLASGLYVLLRRFRPAAAVPVVLAALLTATMLSLLALSPWPRWPIPAPEKAVAPLAAGEQGELSGEAALPDAEAPRAAQFLQSLEAALSQGSAPESARHWPAVLAAVLLAAMACGLGWLTLGMTAVRRQRLRSQPVADGPLLEMVDVLRAELACRRPIEVRRCAELVTAATIGWRRPVLLLPAGWTAWTDQQLRAILAHEIAHVRSRDFLALLCGQAALVLHFYHPLVHWLIGRLRLEQELAADAAAASISGGQRQYLMTIAEIALGQQARPLSWPARAFLPTHTTFLRRIAMLRDRKVSFDRLSPAARGLAVGGVVLCGLLVAGLRGPASQSQALAAEPSKGAAPRPLSGTDEKAFTEIEKMGGKIKMNASNLPIVTLDGARFTDASLLPLEQCTDLQMLIVFQTSVTDAGLEHIRGLTKLRSLNLSNPDITDAGLKQLEGMTQLHALWLSSTQVTDAGLEYLKDHFPDLDFLYLSETKISDAGLKNLEGLLQLTALNLGKTQITDAGLQHVKALANLRFLFLDDTAVTDAGLAHLNGLRGLQQLSLRNTQVTAAGAKKLEQALPKCKIELVWQKPAQPKKEQ
jgi:beta-lactamase regulating signal transducer with metallopeptidase domain